MTNDSTQLFQDDDLYLEEELQILEESVRPPKVLSADNFLRPIADICRPQDLVTLPPAATIAEAVAAMQSHRIGAVLIVEGDQLSGIVTERDLMMKAIGTADDLGGRAVSTIMTPDPETLRREDPIAYLLNMMRVGGFRHVPIVDDGGRPAHLISLRDVLAFIVDNFPAEVLNLPASPFRGVPSEYGG